MANAGGFALAANLVTKKLYEDGFPDQFITDSPYFDKRKTAPLMIGTDMTEAYNAGWQEGVGTNTDTTDVMDPSAPVIRNPTYDAVDIAGTLRVTVKEFERANSSVKSMTNFVAAQIEGGQKNFKRDMEFRLFNDGSGLRGITSGDVAQGSAVTIALTKAIRGGAIRVNMKLRAYNNTSGAVIVTGLLVTSVNISAGTFVVQSVATPIPSGSYLYNDTAIERNGDINGLDNLVDDSTGPATVMGLSSSLSDWQSLVLGNSGTARPLTIDLLDQAYWRSIEQSGGTKATEAWMDYTQVRKATGLVNRQIIDQRKGVSMKVNSHNEIEFIGSAKVNLSDMCLQGTIYNIVAEDFKVKQLRGFTPANLMGNGDIWERIPGTTRYESVHLWMGNHVLKSRRFHTKIEDLATS